MDIRHLAVTASIVSALLASGCQAADQKVSASPPAQGAPPVSSGAKTNRPTYTAAPPVGDLTQYAKQQVVIETERGNIVFELYPKEAPKTVASFVKLAQDGFYDGLTFHRVEPGFVVQGGDPEGNGSGGPGFTLPAEFNAHKHLKGTVAMARTSDPNSAGSQFYICLEAVPQLDGQYTVFGQVTKGVENVAKIQKGDHMLKVRVESKGDGTSPSGGASAAPGGASAAPSAAATPGAASSSAPASHP
ncbi:MAG: peptidylprolyl isomerase [Proteobacteria bacterium]|nr:peptidylprolyl isomerase [Pseudomonadota bacterium]